MPDNLQNLTIIGGGIMGLCTAYYASEFVQRITILEKATIGEANKTAASFSYTRSIRNDYLDPLYARLAYEARKLWLELQSKAAEPFLIDCGCLNIAKESITNELAETYAAQSCNTLTSLHLKTEAFTRETLQQRFPQFDADMGRLDVEAGMLYVPVITQTLLALLKQRHVNIVEGVNVTGVEHRDKHLYIGTDAGEFLTEKLVVTAGLGTNDVLQCIDGCALRFPLIPDRPSQCKYFIPLAEKRAMFTSDALPVFAYLDAGIYGHPIYQGKTPGVKIGFYNPPDINRLNTSIHDVHSFVEECMPALRDADAVDVTDVDQCFYDLVADDNFILGNVPGFSNISVGVGWRGTGYKYAPWVGRTLMQLALQEGTVNDISHFSPQRFVKPDDP
ncbi:MAG TPA: FAD-dependent oxidoreductase [Ktedonobacteraceae bacterium]